jgi:NADH-ubiquinone oxidoreductase chain 6
MPQHATQAGSFNTCNAGSIISVLLETLTNFNGLLFNSEISAINSVNTAYNPNIADTTFTNFLQIEAIGQHLYTNGAFLLIITSVILLLAMVAPIFISRNKS